MGGRREERMRGRRGEEGRERNGRKRTGED